MYKHETTPNPRLGTTYVNGSSKLRIELLIYNYYVRIIVNLLVQLGKETVTRYRQQCHLFLEVFFLAIYDDVRLYTKHMSIRKEFPLKQSKIDGGAIRQTAHLRVLPNYTYHHQYDVYRRLHPNLCLNCKFLRTTT